MQPTDLEHIVVPSDPQLHPDGHRIAFVLTEIDLDEDRYHHTVHVRTGRQTIRFTSGPSDTEPRWSPDGTQLAFLRGGTAAHDAVDASDTVQLAVMASGGGEARTRTSLPLGVSDLAWSPDGRQLVVVGREWIAELADLDPEERRRVPRRITALPFRRDADGWTHEWRDHLWLVDLDEGMDPRCLTPGDGNQRGPAWRPDGAAIGFLGEPDGGSDGQPHSQPFEVELASGTCRTLAPPGMWGSITYGPDGTVYLTGLADPFDWPAPQEIYALRATAGAPTPVSVTGHLDRDVDPPSPPSTTVGPRFVNGGLLTVLEGRGTTGIVQLTANADSPVGWTETEIVGGRRCVTGYSARADGSAIAFTATDSATPGELYWREDGRERCLTDLTKGLRTRIDIRPTGRFRFERADAELDAWVVEPPGFDTAAQGCVPVLFNIHGGPTTQYGEYFFDEFQVQAGAGYLVVGANPRGSSGRGAAWSRSVVGAWSHEDSVDTLDLEAVVDAVLARYPQADPRCVGIMGGSYGGYATARLLARTDRYASAIVERGLLHWESFGGTSDIGAFFDRMFLGASLSAGADVHRRASPTVTAERIRTPTLVLHGEADRRCPIEQGEQLFVALKRAGVPTEMVRFPDEGHELSRSGSPRHRVERSRVVLDWHGRHRRTV